MSSSFIYEERITPKPERHCKVCQDDDAEICMSLRYYGYWPHRDPDDDSEIEECECGCHEPEEGAEVWI